MMQFLNILEITLLRFLSIFEMELVGLKSRCHSYLRLKQQENESLPLNIQN
jgi:cell division protein FtsB